MSVAHDDHRLTISKPHWPRTFRIRLVTPEALPQFHRQTQLMTCLIQIWPRTSTILQVTPEALPKFHRWMPSRSCEGRVKS
jgi:hypothetical protein